MPFKTGQSGNPSGKPKGSGKKHSKRIKSILSDHIDKAMENLVEAVEQGDILSSATVINAILEIERFNKKPVSDTTGDSEKV